MGDEQQPRKLYIMRHAERMDLTFGYGPAWMKKCFDEQDNYIRTDLNMPLSVPKRKGSQRDYIYDCPLTRIGLVQATFAGEAIKSRNVKFSHVFSSPSLRCMETCRKVLEASDQIHLPINVEPGLFEWLEWYVKEMPKWMSPEEMKENGFNVSEDYIPVMNETEILGRKETCEEYYERSFKVASDVLQKYSGKILFVGHASTLDACSRQLVGQQPKNEADMMKCITKLPLTAIAAVELDSGSQWKLIEPPILPPTHLKNAAFDWRILLD
ncbi:hypothetical protein JTE90_009102 [Oedothorax gibbosus]|uniref:Protein UBASH3A-like protein n=1 Tax=Oedothorax gibbosus TaxID=931172 RepID=A0AAV6V2B3_9ARAC|nr:hypothetical protein JTE90_009102 [Oedothorax gibbosus]